jgi:hypothetical protein
MDAHVGSFPTLSSKLCWEQCCSAHDGVNSGSLHDSDYRIVLRVCPVPIAGQLPPGCSSPGFKDDNNMC